jgi:GxxExxY protein
MLNLVDDLLFKEECYKIIGLCMKIHSTLGKGFKEIVYKNALELEFQKNSISYEREKSFKIEYNGSVLSRRFDADFFVFNKIILEIKAATCLHPDNFTQSLNYLKVSGIKLALLINFGEDRLKFRRIICDY